MRAEVKKYSIISDPNIKKIIINKHGIENFR